MATIGASLSEPRTTCSLPLLSKCSQCTGLDIHLVWIVVSSWRPYHHHSPYRHTPTVHLDVITTQLCQGTIFSPVNSTSMMHPLTRAPPYICLSSPSTCTVDREIFTLKIIRAKIFVLINFHGSVQSSKFFCVKCFIRVLNFHSWSQPRNYFKFSQSTVVYQRRQGPPLTRNQPMGRDHLTKLGLTRLPRTETCIHIVFEAYQQAVDS